MRPGSLFPLFAAIVLAVVIYRSMACDCAFAQDKTPSASAAPTKASNSGRKFYNTYPMPPHKKPNDPMRVLPGLEVPLHPERYTWKITAKGVNSAAAPRPSAPVYELGDGVPRIIGQIPVGTEVKLETFAHYGKTLYYAVPFESPTPPDSKVKLAKPLAWVSGLSIEPAAYNPADK